ncbi:hypothetical protein HC928_05970 [bacterium]|nr:hypothetical protein [bacterium]
MAALLPADLDLDALQQALAPDLSCLNWTADYGVDLGDLPAGVRRKLKERDAQTATRLAEVIKQWLLPVIRVLQGEVGYLSLSYGTLTVTTIDHHLVAIAQAAAKNLFLDATGDLAELAAVLGIPMETIDYIAVEEPVGAEVTLTQVTGLGRLGQQRGKEQQARAKAVIDHYRQSRSDLAVIRLKRYAQAGDRRWFVDSRGSNDLQTRKSLLIEGPPCPNLEALKAEFTCIYRQVPGENDPQFAAFVNRRINGEIQQAIGRLRASRRPGEFLEMIFLGDFELDVGLPVQPVNAGDITPDARSKREKWQAAISQAVTQLRDLGQKSLNRGSRP